MHAIVATPHSGMGEMVVSVFETEAEARAEMRLLEGRYMRWTFRLAEVTENA